MSGDGKQPMTAAGESRPSRENKKFTEKFRSYKLEQYYDSFRKLKSTVTKIKKLMLENRDTELVRKEYVTWMDNYEHFLNLFDVLATQTDDIQEKNKLITDHQDYDIFLTNFKKEVEAFFSVQSETVNVNKTKTRSRNSQSLRSPHVSLEKLKEEQKIAELEARKASLMKRKKLEMAKLELTLEEEKLNLETDIAISNAKTEVLEKYELESQLNNSDHGEEESTPRRHLPKPSPRILPAIDSAEIDSALSMPEMQLNPKAETFIPKSERTSPLECHFQDEIKQETTMQYVVQHLKKPVSEIKKFGGNPLEFRRFIRQFNSKVVMNTQDDDERMNYLEQMTFGEAYKVVSGFSHMSGDIAFKAAMKQLEERYGDNEVIATAFVNKAL